MIKSYSHCNHEMKINDTNQPMYYYGFLTLTKANKCDEKHAEILARLGYVIL